MKRLTYIVLGLVWLIVGAFACSTAGGDDEAAPCNNIGQCLPGWVCMSGFCNRGSSNSGTGTFVGRTGGVVRGIDGLTLEVPSGALSDEVEIVFTKLSTSIQLPGVEFVSSVYDIGPQEQSFSLDATLSIPTSTTVSPAAVSIYHSINGGEDWSKLFGASSSTLAIGLTTRLGWFVAGRE